MAAAKIQCINKFRMLNVLSLVSYPFLPPKMGGQKGIAYFNNYVSKHINLTCITTRNNIITDVLGYEVLTILSNKRYRYFNIFYFFTLRKQIRARKITHLILEHPYYGWLGVLLKYMCKVKLIVHSHNIESLRFKSTGRIWWKLLWLYEKFTHQQADGSFFIQENDRKYAIKEFKVDEKKCITVTYGFEMKIPPGMDEKKQAKYELCRQYKMDYSTKLLLFNGTLDYKPNLDALENIIKHINPLLLSSFNINYKLIICGKGLPARYNELRQYESVNIIYAGFVDDINLYFKGADIFINPVLDGGGIKTKLVEALGNGISAVSSQSGAIGVPLTVTGNKLSVVNDHDWPGFTKAIINADTSGNIPSVFFDHFYWGNIAIKAAEFLEKA